MDLQMKQNMCMPLALEDLFRAAYDGDGGVFLHFAIVSFFSISQ